MAEMRYGESLLFFGNDRTNQPVPFYTNHSESERVWSHLSFTSARSVDSRRTCATQFIIIVITRQLVDEMRA